VPKVYDLSGAMGHAVRETPGALSIASLQITNR
jgi:hypothetical protein